MKKQVFALMLSTAIFTTTAAYAMDPAPIAEEDPNTSPRTLSVASTEPAQDQQPTPPIQAIPAPLFQDFTKIEDVNKRILSYFGEFSDLVHLTSTCQYFHNFLGEIIQNKLFIIGQSGSGKSTLVHLLTGKPLIAKKGRISAIEKMPNVDIVHGCGVGTLQPTCVLDFSNKRVIIDSPGFQDGRGPEQEYTNAKKLYSRL